MPGPQFGEKRVTGLAPIEILKGHLPPELVQDFYEGSDLAQPQEPAHKLIERVWELRNVPNFLKTTESSESQDALVGDKFLWSGGLTNKSVPGVCVKSMPTAVRLKLDSGRLVWVPRNSVKPVPKKSPFS